MAKLYQSERQVSFPLLSSEPVRLDAVRSLTVYVYSCILGCTIGKNVNFSH